MTLLKPDPTFYPSPMMATQSPVERLAYVALINPLKDGRTDAIGVVDLDPASASYGRLIGQTDMPHPGDELHHFGRIHILDTKRAGHVASTSGTVAAMAVGLHTLAYFSVMALTAWVVIDNSVWACFARPGSTWTGYGPARWSSPASSCCCTSRSASTDRPRS